MAVATDRQLHEDQEYSSSSAHCKCNDPGIFVFVSVLILAMIQDQALVASKHLLVETEDKNLADNAVENFNNACTGEPMCLGNGGCRCCGAACHCSDAGCRCTKSGLKMFVPKCHILGPQTDGDYWMGKK